MLLLLATLLVILIEVVFIGRFVFPFPANVSTMPKLAAVQHCTSVVISPQHAKAASTLIEPFAYFLVGLGAVTVWAERKTQTRIESVLQKHCPCLLRDHSPQPFWVSADVLAELLV